MRFLTLAVLARFAGLGLGSPVASSHIEHERRDHVPEGWTYLSGARGNAVLPVRIGLTQSNLDTAHDVLMEVSDPSSPKYGQHWSDADIIKYFAPSTESVEAIKAWLQTSGIAADRVFQSSGKGWLEFDATVSEMENLLKTEYHFYEHETGAPHVLCDHYSVPTDIQKHIDIITPTIHFDAIVTGSKGRKIKKRDAQSSTSKWTGPKKLPFNPPVGTINFTPDNLCGEFITPRCLRTLYGLPVNKYNLSSFGIAEFFPYSYRQGDLNLFQNNTSLGHIGIHTNSGGIPIGTAPTFVPIDGGFIYDSGASGYTYLQGEPDLDLEYAMDLAYPQQVTLLQGGDSGSFSFNNFLDAFDASYCAGDDPYYDETFPNPNGYNHSEDCGTITAPAVISISYAYNEHDLSPAYEARQCMEYLKLGLKGTSFLFSSGDHGVAGNQGTCIQKNGSYTGIDAKSGKFNPSFPGTCPYITAVGATQIPEGTSATTPEIACATVIYSGGGFSNNFAVPSYQKSAVKNWFQNFKPSYSASRYNSTGKSRGLPDVSANGAWYVVFIDGVDYFVFGTSASAPVFAAIVTQINNERINAGKTVLGFLNPSFYANPGMFNDIIEGNNPGCGTKGFEAVSGWDPVTGLGTPNYPKMLKYFLKLP